MGIICGPETAKINCSSTVICGKTAIITNIQPNNANRVDLSIDGNAVYALKSGSTFIIGKQIYSLFLVSKDVASNSATIRLTISDDPCSNKTCPNTCVGADLWSFVPVRKYDKNLVPTECVCNKNKLITTNSPNCTTGGVSAGAIAGIGVIVMAASVILYVSRRR